MAMFNPPHPGRMVRQECLEPLGLSVTEGAKVLGVTRQARQQSDERQERDFRGDGRAPRRRVRQRRGILGSVSRATTTSPRSVARAGDRRHRPPGGAARGADVIAAEKGRAGSTLDAFLAEESVWRKRPSAPSSGCWLGRSTRR